MIGKQMGRALPLFADLCSDLALNNFSLSVKDADESCYPYPGVKGGEKTLFSYSYPRI